MSQCLLREWLVVAQTLENYRIGTFAEDLDPATWATHNGRHPLARRIELADIQYLVFTFRPEDVDEYRLGFPRL